MLKRKSMEELKDCLDVIHAQLQQVFYSKCPNQSHINKLSKWYDQVAVEIDYRTSMTISSELSRSYINKEDLSG